MMTYVSSVQAPDRNRFLKVHQWQSDFCEGDFCTTMILAHFQSWHDWKLSHDEYYAKVNDVAEMHNDGRPYPEDALLFFSTEDLSDAIFGAYGKQSINKAVTWLISRGVLSLHDNPIKRYSFLRTKHFRFHANTCRLWIKQNYDEKGRLIQKSISSPCSKTRDLSHLPKMDNRVTEIEISHFENDQWGSDVDQEKNELVQKPEQTRDLSHLPKMDNRVTEIERHIDNNINKQINKLTAHAREDNFNSQSQKPQNDLNEVTEKLIELGLSKHKVFSDESIDAIEQVLSQGATVSTFVEAYERSVQATEGSFGMRYLIKSVQSILSRANQRTQARAKPNNQIDRQDNPKTSAQTQNAGSPEKINPYPWANPMAAKEWLDFEALGVSLNLNSTQKVDEDQGGAQS